MPAIQSPPCFFYLPHQYLKFVHESACDDVFGPAGQLLFSMNRNVFSILSLL